MIKLPKEINETIKKIEEAGFKGYAVGGCVRDSLLGIKPLDWDLTTDAKLNNLMEIFPEAQILNEKFSVIRLDFTKSEDDDINPILDIATFRVEGIYEEYGKPSTITFIDNIEKDLERRDFTVNAMAANPQTGFVDPYDGRKDLRDKIIKVIGEPEERFKEDPLRILRAIRFAAEKNFEIDEETFEGMASHIQLLDEISNDKIRDEFIKIIEGEFAGKGLVLLMETGAIRGVIGQNFEKISLRKKELYRRLAKNIDETYPVGARRLGLFYSIFDKAEGAKFIEKLNFPNKLKTHLMDSIYNMGELGAIKEDYELKGFMSEYGLERYSYMEKLAQDKVVAYKGTARRTNKRKAFAERFEMMHEPIFMNDLVIGGKDLEDIGIRGDKIGEILQILLEEVHRKPYKNNKHGLMEMANTYKKSPMRMKMRRSKWLKRFR